jgi:hypothetical protein
MAIRSFGSGKLFVQRTDVPNATPTKFADLQDVAVDFSGTSKEVYGEGQFPVAVGRGTGKITGKAKSAQIQSRIYADLFFGTPLTTGRSALAQGEAGIIPAVAVAGTYALPVANAANFQKDLGVLYAASNIPFQRVAAAPTVGQYTVNANGIYNFAAADEGVPVVFNYLWLDASKGQTMTFMNPDQGVQPVFSVELATQFTSSTGTKGSVLTLYACISDKLSIATKQADWMIPEFDFSAQQDDAGRVFSWSFDEAQ